MALWDQGGGSGFQQRKAGGGDADGGGAQRSTVKGVLTCTVATVLAAKHSDTDNCFVYKHLKFNTVMVMGLIREANHEVNGSLATYIIDDHSGGLLEIKWWHDESSEPLKPLSYVKVVGQVKTFAGKAHVVAHHVSKMQSLNELIAHAIECVHASMCIRKQAELGGAAAVATNHNLGGGFQNQHAAVSNTGFTPAQNAVLSHLKTVTSMTGCSVTDICRQLKQFSENQVKQALEFLSGEGHIYSTTDDDHFRAASNN